MLIEVIISATSSLIGRNLEDFSTEIASFSASCSHITAGHFNDLAERRLSDSFPVQAVRLSQNGCDTCCKG